MAEDDGSAIKTGIPVATFHIEEAIRSAQGMLAAPADRAAGRSSRNRPHMRLAEFCLKSPASGDRAGSADVRGGPAFLVMDPPLKGRACGLPLAVSSLPLGLLLPP